MTDQRKQIVAGDRLLTIRDVSEFTGLAVGTLYHLVSEGRIPVVRFSSRCIRFRVSALEKWFDDLSRGPMNESNDRPSKSIQKELQDKGNEKS